MREQARLAYHVVRNLRIALRNAALGERYAELRALQRAGRVMLGEGTYGYPTIKSYSRHDRECLRAGRYCSLNGTFVLGGRHGDNFVTTYPHRINFQMPGAGSDGFPTPVGDTIVGSDVWTCEGALILSGITLGDGAIVAAGAVVTKDVPPYAIVGGNPARVIRYRFDEPQIAELLAIRWWDWPETRIREAVRFLASPDVDAFIRYAHGDVRALSGAGAR